MKVGATGDQMIITLDEMPIRMKKRVGVYQRGLRSYVVPPINPFSATLMSTDATMCSRAAFRLNLETSFSAFLCSCAAFFAASFRAFSS